MKLLSRKDFSEFTDYKRELVNVLKQEKVFYETHILFQVRNCLKKVCV